MLTVGAPRGTVFLPRKPRLEVHQVLPELNTVQQAAVDFIVNRRSAFALGGYAGTGKTVTAAAAAEQLGDRAVLFAPTNKAAMVLAAKTGKKVATVHKGTLRVFPAISRLEDGQFVWQDDLEFYPGSPSLPEDAMIIIDEASMIGGELFDKVLTAVGDVPIALIGDPFQLPPINDEPLFHRALQEWPSLYLTEVYRQKAGSPVLDFATPLREDWAQMEGTFVRDHLDRLSPVDPGFLGAAYTGKGVVITVSNELRMAKILQMRRELWAGHAEIEPQPGEPMVAYRTDYTSGLMNGVLQTVEACETVGGKWYVDVVDEVGRRRKKVPVAPGMAFNSQQKKKWQATRKGEPRRPAPLTFAYALTAHAGQGSQWPYVIVENEKIGGVDDARHVYTAVTRAQEEVYVL